MAIKVGAEGERAALDALFAVCAAEVARAGSGSSGELVEAAAPLTAAPVQQLRPSRTLASADESELSISVSFGKNIFLECPTPGSRSLLEYARGYTIPELRGFHFAYGPDGDFKIKFSHELSPDDAKAIEVRALAMGLTPLGATWSTASLQLSDHGRADGAIGTLTAFLELSDLYADLGIAYPSHAASGVTVTKLVSRAAKVAVVSFMSPGAAGAAQSPLESRLHLLRKRHVREGQGDSDADAAWAFARACTYDPSTKELHLPEYEAASRFKVEVRRVSHARVFEGRHAGVAVRLECSRSIENGPGVRYFAGRKSGGAPDQVFESRQAHGFAPGMQEALKAGQLVPAEDLEAFAGFCETLLNSNV